MEYAQLPKLFKTAGQERDNAFQLGVEPLLRNTSPCAAAWCRYGGRRHGLAKLLTFLMALPSSIRSSTFKPGAACIILKPGVSVARVLLFKGRGALMGRIRCSVP